MAEGIMHTEMQQELPNEMNQKNLSESAQQIVELTPLLSSQPSDLSSNCLQQQQQTSQMEDEVTIDIKKMIQNCGHGLRLSDCCIYRVPVTMRPFKENAYIPKVVSIGPLHYGDKRLEDMERHKQILFNRFTERAMVNLDDLVCYVKHLEPKVRASYSETINLTEQQLVKLTLIDAVFIIQLFIVHSECDYYIDAKLSHGWLINSIIEDLILLENQLPFFVIEGIFDKAFPYGHRGSLPSFFELSCCYFEYYNQKKSKLNPDDVKIKHFLDLVRSFYLQGKMFIAEPIPEDYSHRLLYNASALQEAGIKLKASKSECLLDLKFSGDILEIPQILVDGSTDSLFRNLIALEECHYPDEAFISDYALVWDFLVDTHQDVDILVHKKILRNYFGDVQHVPLVFNRLAENFIRRNFNSEYLDIVQRLNGYCEHWWHKRRATLKRDYCRTTWQILASIAAILLLLLTIAQTVFSILQVVQK